MIKKASFFLVVIFLFSFLTPPIQASIKYLMIPGNAFIIDEEFTISMGYSSGVLWGEGTAYAPIYLPHKAGILEVSMSCEPRDVAVGWVSFEVKRINALNLQSQQLFWGAAQGVGHQIISDDTLNSGSRIVNNRVYYYIVKVHLQSPVPGGASLYCIQIRYR